MSDRLSDFEARLQRVEEAVRMLTGGVSPPTPPIDEPSLLPSVVPSE